MIRDEQEWDDYEERRYTGEAQHHGVQNAALGLQDLGAAHRSPLLETRQTRSCASTLTMMVIPNNRRAISISAER